MNASISWIATSALAAMAALGCRTGEEGAAPRSEGVAATEPTAPAVQEPDRAREQEPKPAQSPTVQEPSGRFLANAFPPTVPDTEWHRDAWMQQSCLRCHETGVGDAPQVVHRGMPDILLTAKCRTCHVFIPGSKPRPKPEPAADDPFAKNAFPPMIPASDYHAKAWTRDDCLLCHESGVKGAPRIVHEGLPPLLLQSKCRTCHVQVRVVEASGR